MEAALLLREGPVYRREAFAAGLTQCGFFVRMDWPTAPSVIVTWNRYGRFDEYCRRQEASGVPVLVVENGYFGKDTFDTPVFAMSLGAHAGAGRWPRATGAARWAQLGLHPLPLQRPPAGRGLRALALGQRGIGQPGVASPEGWARTAAQLLHGWGVSVVIREHPGNLAAQRLAPDLRRVLEDVDFVATWNSGAAIKAMLLGKPVLYAAPHWVAARGALPLCRESLQKLPHMEDTRQQGFEDVAAAQWSLDEISSGEAIRSLLEYDNANPICG